MTLRGRVSMNSTASATSFGCIRLPLASASSIFAFGQSSSSAVTTGPGSTAPTRTPCCATWRRVVCTKACTANFEPCRSAPRPPARRPAIELVNEDVAGLLRDHVRQDRVDRAEGGVDVEVQHPVPGVRIAFRHRRRRYRRRHWRGRCRARRPSRGCAAACPRPARGPSDRRPAGCAFGPSSAQSASSLSSARSISTTFAPAASMARAHSRPMPEAAPVMAATLPFSSFAHARLLRGQARPWLTRGAAREASTMTAIARTPPVIM